MALVLDTLIELGASLLHIGNGGDSMAVIVMIIALQLVDQTFQARANPHKVVVAAVLVRAFAPARPT